MAMDIAVIATDKTVVLALRALQFIFSIIVIGTDSYGTCNHLVSSNQ